MWFEEDGWSGGGTGVLYDGREVAKWALIRGSDGCGSETVGLRGLEFPQGVGCGTVRSAPDGVEV